MRGRTNHNVSIDLSSDMIASELGKLEEAAANLQTKSLDFGGFDSSRFLLLKGGIPRSAGLSHTFQVNNQTSALTGKHADRQVAYAFRHNPFFHAPNVRSSVKAGVTSCTPEIDTSKVIVDLSGMFQWITSGMFHWMLTFVQRHAPVDSCQNGQRRLPMDLNSCELRRALLRPSYYHYYCYHYNHY